MKEYATVYKQDLELLKKDSILAGETAITIIERAFNVPEEEKLIQNPCITAYIKQKRDRY